jgi:hypothetical protein
MRPWGWDPGVKEVLFCTDTICGIGRAFRIGREALKALPALCLALAIVVIPNGAISTCQLTGSAILVHAYGAFLTVAGGSARPIFTRRTLEDTDCELKGGLQELSSLWKSVPAAVDLLMRACKANDTTHRKFVWLLVFLQQIFILFNGNIAHENTIQDLALHDIVRPCYDGA